MSSFVDVPRVGSAREVRRQTRELLANMRGPWSLWQSVNTRGASGNPPGVVMIHRNNYFTVLERRTTSVWGIVTHLMVRRHDEKPIREWAVLQRIKDELASPEATAVEVFPPRADLIDQANMYHLWVLPNGFSLPFGLHLWERE